jgi:hypothetical protein
VIGTSHERSRPPEVAPPGVPVLSGAYRRGMADVPLLPQHDRIVLVVLQDGRQLEGELIVLTDRFQVGGRVFETWEIETIEDFT